MELSKEWHSCGTRPRRMGGRVSRGDDKPVEAGQQVKVSMLSDKGGGEHEIGEALARGSPDGDRAGTDCSDKLGLRATAGTGRRQHVRRIVHRGAAEGVFRTL